MTWLLTICTAGFIICGTTITQEYPTEDQCYRAIESLYRLQGKSAFIYVTCSPQLKERNHG